MSDFLLGLFPLLFAVMVSFAVGVSQGQRDIGNMQYTCQQFGMFYIDDTKYICEEVKQ